MARGGARNRSGPLPVEGSRTSERKGYVLTALPLAGFDGEAPEFPLPSPTAREIAVWSQAWATPQACAWSLEPWRWNAVAMWCRWSVRMEAADASAALGNMVVRFADQIGMTPAGLRENGWKIAEPAAAEAAPETSNVTSIKDRLNRGSA